MNKWIMGSLFILLFLFLSPACQRPMPTETTTDDFLSESNADFDQRMEWWRDAKFGMFIHWGLYAIPAGVYEGDTIPGIGEWIMQRAPIPVKAYEKYAAQFNPVQFDAREWARIAKEAGMKYLVITSKHHDGFCLWDSAITDYDIMDASPYKQDLLAQLAEACKAEGIRLGFYHSIMDWHHPDAQAPHYPTYNTKEKSNPKFPDYFENYMKPQVAELIQKYDPEILWFDGEWIPEFTHEQGLELYQFVRAAKPSILVNNRVDKGRQGMQGMNKEGDFAGDFGTPEQEILDKTSDFDWESCMTMNNTWGYKSYDNNWKSTETLVHNLIDVAAKGGNYLLNVGPTAEGLIPAPSVERLRAMGQWLRTNGEAIYATEKLANYKQDDHVLFTKKKDNDVIYTFILQDPGTSITLQNIQPKEGAAIRLLGHDEALKYAMLPNGLRINLPANLEFGDETYAWVLRIPGKEQVVQ